jgi:histidine phosphotransferase ChpT
MGYLPQDLSALVGSRLCHDLISPIGAIGNGLELLSMTGTRSTPEMDLVVQSVANAQARIRLFRVAFGIGQSDQTMGTPEMVEIVRDVYRTGRVRVAWDTAGGVGRDDAKLALLLVLCLEAALSHGGTITVTRDGRSWTLTGAGTRLRDLGGMWPLLEGGDAPDPITADRVQFPLAHAQARDMGCVIHVTPGAGSMTLRVAPA